MIKRLSGEYATSTMVQPTCLALISFTDSHEFVSYKLIFLSCGVLEVEY